MSSFSRTTHQVVSTPQQAGDHLIIDETSHSQHLDVQNININFARCTDNLTFRASLTNQENALVNINQELDPDNSNISTSVSNDTADTTVDEEFEWDLATAFRTPREVSPVISFMATDRLQYMEDPNSFEATYMDVYPSGRPQVVYISPKAKATDNKHPEEPTTKPLKKMSLDLTVDSFTGKEPVFEELGGEMEDDWTGEEHRFFCVDGDLALMKDDENCQKDAEEEESKTPVVGGSDSSGVGIWKSREIVVEPKEVEAKEDEVVLGFHTVSPVCRQPICKYLLSC